MVVAAVSEVFLIHSHLLRPLLFLLNSTAHSTLPPKFRRADEIVRLEGNKRIDMITSSERILVTHVGSLPRNDELSDLLVQREESGTVDKDQLAKAMDRGVRHVVEKQMEAGIDIGNDGEQQRVAFQTYMAQRMSGFAGES